MFVRNILRISENFSNFFSTMRFLLCTRPRAFEGSKLENSGSQNTLRMFAIEPRAVVLNLLGSVDP
jgi:hypothetical protein